MAMSLRRLIDRVRSREKTLTVYAPPNAGVVDAVREHFASQHVAVEHEPTTDAAPHAVLADDGEYLASVGVDALDALAAAEPHPIGEDAPYRPLLEHLDRTTFSSYSREQMTQASREIEDRAWRANGGQLHTGFQRLSNVKPQLDTYETIAESDVDVHVYGVPDADLGDVPFAVHAEDSDELAATWFVVFDGGGDRQQSSALLAKEEPDGGFYGFWTYDPALVEEALGELSTHRQPA
jgi:DICT domain-containing protein